MSKPIFLFCPGIAKCGTTMMQMILSYYNTVLHYGYLKESHYLHLVQCARNLDYGGAYQYHYRTFFDDQKIFGNIATTYTSIPSGQLFYPKLAEHLPKKISKEVHDKWFSSDFNVKTYVDFYRDLYQTVSSIYCGVADFSTSNEDLMDDIIIEVKNNLSEYFDVKCLLLFRDPAKRFFSLSNMIKRLNELSYIPSIIPNLSVPQIYDGFIYNEYYQNLYPRVYEKYYNIFQENLFIANEQIFSECDNFQLPKLLKFLNFPNINITNIKPANKQEYKEIMTDDQVLEGRLLLKPNYDFYNSMFGIK